MKKLVYIGAFSALLLTACSEDDTKSKEETPGVEPAGVNESEKIVSSLTAEERGPYGLTLKMRLYIEDVYDKETNTGKSRVVSINDVEGTLKFVLNSDNEYNVEAIRTNALSKSENILDTLVTYGGLIGDVSIDWMLPLVDDYGNETDELILGIHLKNETLHKINFDNFSHEKFSTIADDYYEHPALNDK